MRRPCSFYVTLPRVSRYFQIRFAPYIEQKVSQILCFSPSNSIALRQFVSSLPKTSNPRKFGPMGNTKSKNSALVDQRRPAHLNPESPLDPPPAYFTTPDPEKHHGRATTCKNGTGMTCRGVVLNSRSRSRRPNLGTTGRRGSGNSPGLQYGFHC